jgi:hypothetical protein
VVLPMPPLVNRSRVPVSVTLIGTAPDSELLVGIDGTSSKKWRETDPETQRATNSNVFNMVKDFEGPHLYLVGPTTLGTDVRIIRQELWRLSTLNFVRTQIWRATLSAIVEGVQRERAWTSRPSPVNACLVGEPAAGRLRPANDRAYHPNASGDGYEGVRGRG